MKIDSKNKIIYGENFAFKCDYINPVEGCGKLLWIGGFLLCMMSLAG